MMDKRDFTLKDASLMLGVSSAVIRHYCNSGLVPHVRRNHSGYRILEQWQIDHIGMLINMKRAGFKARDLKRYADLFRQGESTEPERLAMFQTRRRQIWQEIEQYQNAIGFIERQEELIKKEK